VAEVALHWPWDYLIPTWLRAESVFREILYIVVLKIIDTRARDAFLKSGNFRYHFYDHHMNKGDIAIKVSLGSS
jgi:hypothetical protein